MLASLIIGGITDSLPIMQHLPTEQSDGDDGHDAKKYYS